MKQYIIKIANERGEKRIMVWSNGIIEAAKKAAKLATYENAEIISIILKN